MLGGIILKSKTKTLLAIFAGIFAFAGIVSCIAVGMMPNRPSRDTSEPSRSYTATITVKDNSITFQCSDLCYLSYQPLDKNAQYSRNKSSCTSASLEFGVRAKDKLFKIAHIDGFESEETDIYADDLSAPLYLKFVSTEDRVEEAYKYLLEGKIELQVSGITYGPVPETVQVLEPVSVTFTEKSRYHQFPTEITANDCTQTAFLLYEVVDARTGQKEADE